MCCCTNLTHPSPNMHFKLEILKFVISGMRKGPMSWFYLDDLFVILALWKLSLFSLFPYRLDLQWLFNHNQ